MTDDRLPDGAMPDIELTAAELALGLLEGQERTAAEHRLEREPAFADAVERWRSTFEASFPIAMAEAPPELRARVLAAAGVGGVGSSGPAANDNQVWKLATAIASLVAICLLVVVLTRPVPAPVSLAPAPAPATVLFAQLTPTSGEAHTLPAVYQPQAAALRIAAADLSGAQRSAELWLIPDDGVPRALGLLDRSGSTVLRLKPATRGQIGAGAALAVSIEPVGGSTTGKPTGPIVAKGVLTEI